MLALLGAMPVIVNEKACFLTIKLWSELKKTKTPGNMDNMDNYMININL
jgi:hypothetical protein